MANRTEQTLVEMQADFSEEWESVSVRNSDRILARRISARLHSDKTVGKCKIQITAKDAVVELKGQVKDIEQQRRVIDLAQSTFGVKKVHDNLTLSD